jgi:hypothetical protein
MDGAKLISDFNSEIDLAFRTAWHSEKGGDESWINFMKEYDISPLSGTDKELLLNSEMKITRGAFPIELRKVYEKIIYKYKANASTSSQLSGILNNFDIDAKVKEYYQKIKPFSGLWDIFKNAYPACRTKNRLR